MADAPKNPAILCVDDDPDVLRAVARDLRRHYGEQYRVLRADSGAEALDAVRELVQRNEPVALVLSDQRMPQMDGVGLLAQVAQVSPAPPRRSRRSSSL